VRRRRRRSAFARQGPDLRWLWAGLGTAAVLGAFVFFLRQAEVLAPEPTAISVDLPDAFKE
jgi:hypothetical protein